MITVTVMLLVVSVYLAIGLLFALPFVIKGVTKIDEGAAGSGWGFRLIIIPGVIVFWPVLLKKWIKAAAV
jgi:TM2 domain-containing membrane protein YozV